jgi:4-hydroxy-4-methyl-2-oxoglutarate aldolase
VSAYTELAELGTATVYEASGRQGLIDLDLICVIPGSRVAGPARIARCEQGDNLMVHAAMDRLQPGEVLVMTTPEPEPLALFGDLLGTQAKARGAAAILVDGAVRDVEALRELELPVWARWVRVRGANRTLMGALDEPVEIGGATISPGDALVLDEDGAVAVPGSRLDEVLEASRERAAGEEEKREKFGSGVLSIDLYGLRGRFDAGNQSDNLDK